MTVVACRSLYVVCACARGGPRHAIPAQDIELARHMNEFADEFNVVEER